MKKLVLLTTLALLLAASAAAHATYYPNTGSFYYDGQWFAESSMTWYDPGSWSTSQPGYEHDLMVDDTYFSSCTSYSGLPNGYDDCPTAGTLDPAGKRIYTFGSFDADFIQANTSYWGYWQFSGGSTYLTDYGLYGQEVQHSGCFWDGIWCMGGVPGHQQLLRSGVMNWYQSFTVYW